MARLLQWHPKVHEAIAAKADEAKIVAKSIAPVETGAYLAGIDVDERIENGSPTTRVVAKDWKSNWIEFGTARGFPAHAVLRRACEAVGGTLSKRNSTR